RAWHALFAAQTGWMLDAMDFLLFSFAVIPIREEFGLSNGTMGGLTSVALIASAIGGMVFGRLADGLGRVRALTLSILLYSVATAGLATSAALWQLVAWRIAVGLGMGGEWSCGTVLVAETWPAQHRGKAMGLVQSGWAIGALIAAALSAFTLERYGWRLLFLFGALPAIAAFLIRRNVQEPPVSRDRRGRARAALRLLRPHTGDAADARPAGRLLRTRLLLAVRRDARGALPDAHPWQRPRLLLQQRPRGLGIRADRDWGGGGGTRVC